MFKLFHQEKIQKNYLPQTPQKKRRKEKEKFIPEERMGVPQQGQKWRRKMLN